MRYTGIGILLVFGMLAMISRKNFSKYKAVRGGLPVMLCYGIADRLTQGNYCSGLKSGIRNLLRKIQTVREAELEKRAEEYLIRTMAVIPGVMFGFGLLCLLLSFMPSAPCNAVKRNSYGGDEKRCRIEVVEGKNRKEYDLSVYPREYEYEDFLRLSEEAYVYVSQTLAGENADLDHISSDLNFPVRDASKTLSIKWKTDNALLISRTGKVDVSELEREEPVRITAYVTDGIYEKEYHWNVTVCKDDGVPQEIEPEEEMLLSLEKESRTDEYFRVPEKIGNAEVHVNQENGMKLILQLFLVSLLVTGICIYSRYYKLKETCRKRNEFLEAEYFHVLNKLVLMIGAGMAVRSVFYELANEKRNYRNVVYNNLNGEIRICLNELKAGKTERDAYSALGNRIGMPQYMKLLSLIGQNASHGNSNLLELLEQEEREAMFTRKEYARKKGEEASGKLLLPMFLLMITVIGIVMFPAVISL